MKFILIISLASCFNVQQDQTASQDSGFIPYQVQKSSKIGQNTVVTTATVASIVLPMFMSFAGGFVVGAGLGTFAFSYAARNAWDDPVAAYTKMWGKVEKQIFSNINSKAVAVMSDQLRTLSENVNDLGFAYMAELGVANQQVMIANTIGPRVFGVTVDKYMKSLDNVLSASNAWAKFSPVDALNPEFSVLVNAKELGAGKCLHTQGGKIEDGTLLVVDAQCEMHSLGDKLFSVDVLGRLIMRTTLGDKCISYRTKRFRNHLKQPLAIYSLGSKQCEQGRAIKLQYVDNQYSLFDGSRMICVSNGSKDYLNALVTTEKGKDCLNNNHLGFANRIPIPMTDAQGSLVPAQSFDEMGVQIFYMPTFAAIHLGALKEMYLHGTQKNFAQIQFEAKRLEYIAFLENNLPIFADYATFRNLNVEESIQNALAFYNQLQRATLGFAPAIIQLQ